MKKKKVLDQSSLESLPMVSYRCRYLLKMNEKNEKCQDQPFMKNNLTHVTFFESCQKKLKSFLE